MLQISRCPVEFPHQRCSSWRGEGGRMWPKAVATPWGLGFGCSRAMRLWPEGWLGGGAGGAVARAWPPPSELERSRPLGPPPPTRPGPGLAASASLVSSSAATPRSPGPVVLLPPASCWLLAPPSLHRAQPQMRPQTHPIASALVLDPQLLLRARFSCSCSHPSLPPACPGPGTQPPGQRTLWREKGQRGSLGPSGWV